MYYNYFTNDSLLLYIIMDFSNMLNCFQNLRFVPRLLVNFALTATLIFLNYRLTVHQMPMCSSKQVIVPALFVFREL